MDRSSPTNPLEKPRKISPLRFSQHAPPLPEKHGILSRLLDVASIDQLGEQNVRNSRAEKLPAHPTILIKRNETDPKVSVQESVKNKLFNRSPVFPPRPK
jgi:hypothetical protein